MASPLHLERASVLDTANHEHSWTNEDDQGLDAAFLPLEMTRWLLLFFSRPSKIMLPFLPQKNKKRREYDKRAHKGKEVAVASISFPIPWWDCVECRPDSVPAYWEYPVCTVCSGHISISDTLTPKTLSSLWIQWAIKHLASLPSRVRCAQGESGGRARAQSCLWVRGAEPRLSVGWGSLRLSTWVQCHLSPILIPTLLNLPFLTYP